MATLTNAVDSHPQRAQIIADILAQKPYRQIAATLRPPIHYTSIQRYANSIVAPAQRASTSTISDANAVDKAWTQAKMVQIIETSMMAKKPDLGIARATLVNLADLNGWNAPKRTESLVANLHALAPAQLRAVLAQVTSALPAAMQHQLQAGEPDIIDATPLLPAPDSHT